MTEARPWHVVAVGGTGGGLAWLFAELVGLPQVMPSWWVAVPGGIALGAGASFLGVYLLANARPSPALHCLAFALLCGFSWKPVFEAGSALFNRSLQTRAVTMEAAELEERTRSVNARLASGGADVVREANRLADDLVGTAARAEPVNPPLAESLRELATALNAESPTDPSGAARVQHALAQLEAVTKE